MVVFRDTTLIVWKDAAEFVILGLEIPNRTITGRRIWRKGSV
jgi:hypothetical protein